MQNEDPATPVEKAFPAAKVGIIVGMSASLTIVVVALILWCGRAVLFSIQQNAADEQASAEFKRAMAVTAPFKQKLHGYLEAVEASHEAATHGWKAFEAAETKVEAAEKELQTASSTSAESLFETEATGNQRVFALCVSGAIGPGIKVETLKECESRSGMADLRALVDKVDASK